MTFGDNSPILSFVCKPSKPNNECLIWKDQYIYDTIIVSMGSG